MTNDRKWVLVAVLVLIGLPLVLAATEAVSYAVVNRHNGALVSSGEAREYLLYVPRSYDPARPAPLIISLHGGALWGAGQMAISQWNEVADREGLIVVYPSGVAGNGPRHWRVGDGDEVNGDVKFISDLIDKLAETYNVDPARIYANGLSNGGGMSFVLSCTLSDRIASVGLVGAAHFLPVSWCTGPRQVPVISFHGTADRFAGYYGGTSWVAPKFVFPNISKFTADWARKNQCRPDPVESVVADDVTRLEYTECADDADVVLYTVRNGHHTWPGGGPMPEWFAGPTSTSVDATNVMWEFFKEHPLR